MEITCIGHSSYKIKGKNAILITDPYDQDRVGLKYPKLEADMVTVSHEHDGHSFVKGVSGSPIIISGPGEYEVKAVKIIGFSAYHDDAQGANLGRNTVYKISMDGVTIVHCGDLGHKLSDKEMEIMDNVDILMVPVGGIYTITAKTASEVITQLEPKVVIPMHYKKDGMKEDIYGKLSPLSEFLKEVGKEQTISQPKLVLTKDKIPAEMTVVVLE